MTLRWPLVGSLVALIVGAGVAAIVLALCGESGGDSSVTRRPTRTPVSRTVTVTRTPSGGTPVTTGTPDGTPSARTPPAGTATPGSEPSPEVTPPAGETTTPIPLETPSPAPPTSTPLPTSTPTPVPLLPDLVLLDIFVSKDRLGLLLSNQGEGELSIGQEVEFRVRGVMADPVTLTQDLLPGTSVSIVLENEVIYEPGLVLAVADPNNVIAEKDDGNNGIAKQLAPDVAPDLAVHNVFRSVETQRLLVVIRNPTDAPAVQATVVVTVYLGGVAEPAAITTYQLSIEPLGFETVEVIGVAAVPGTEVRVIVEMTDPPDANPANNEKTVSIS